jgi:uncharacterized MnhB-related membrane protein
MATLSGVVWWAFDSALVLLLVGLSWRMLRCQDLFTAVMLFIAFGLVMALVWVRLNAPDVALAEVAIGAGVTGALLVASLARLEQQKQREPNEGTDHAP